MTKESCFLVTKSTFELFCDELALVEGVAGRFAALILSNCIRINLLFSLDQSSKVDFVTKNEEMFVTRTAKGGAVRKNEVEALALRCSRPGCATGFW